MSDLHISDVECSAAPPSDQARGLLCFVSFTIDDCIRIDGVTLRLSKDGRPILSFPKRTEKSGRRRPIVHPVSLAARDHVTHLILDAVGRHGQRKADAAIARLSLEEQGTSPTDARGDA